MSKPVWITEQQDSYDIIAYCVTHGKWVNGAGTGLFDSADGFNFATLSHPSFGGGILGIAGTDVATTRGLVVCRTGGGIWEMDSLGNWTKVSTSFPSGSLSTAGKRLYYLPGIGFFAPNIFLGNPADLLSVDGVTWSGPYGSRHFNPVIIKIGTVGIMCVTTASLDFSPDGQGWTQINTTAPDDLCYVPTMSKWIGFKGIDTPPFGITDVKITQYNADGTGFSFIHSFGSNILPAQIFFEPRSSKIVLTTFNDTLISDDGVTWESIGMIDPNGMTSSSGSSAIIAGKVLYSGFSGGTWPPDDTVMAVMVSDDYGYNGYLSDGWDVNPSLGAPTSPNLIENSPGDFNFQFDLPVEPNVQQWNVVRTNNSTGVQTIVLALANTSGAQDVHDVTTAGVYTYSVFGVDVLNQQLTESISAINATPDIDVVGSGGYTLGGSATIAIEADPSGLYAITVGKTHDTLYDRMPGGTTVDVAIPNPFFKTGFIGDGND